MCISRIQTHPVGKHYEILLHAVTNSFHEVPFEEAGLKVPLSPTAWPDGRCERVSVNSFGIGGTNAHVRENLESIRW
jgi:hypothetical protein